MTSTDTAGHPDVTELSDLAEGLLPPSRTTDVRRHLAGCDLCADVYASLEEIRGLLGTLPGPPRMPADVAGRIDAALAAEALLQSRAADTTDTAAGAGVSPPSGDDGAPVSRETPSSADRPAGHPRSSSTGPGRKGRNRAGRRRIAVLGAVFTVAALGLGSMLLSSLDDGKDTPAVQGQQSASPDTFSEGTLGKQVSTLLAQSRREGGGPRTPDSFGRESGPSVNSPKILKELPVPGCVREGIGRGDPALAVDKGTYKGREALLVVLPDASDDTRVVAYIVDATCVDHPSSTGPGKVLLERSYPSS
ncbi:anti-sigma factor family protein [Streptomyces sp. NPDC085946]|uniref:anti-sigma factor family protein n=1 Tax=Streptomyces sp. NPDC085946 TaxID=3365744 RepID=UPI0037CFBBCC